MPKQLFCSLLAVLCLMVLAFATDAQVSRASVSAAEVNGTFKMNFAGKYKDFSNEIKILALGGGKVRIAFDLVYPYTLANGDPMVNIGTLDDEASITGNTAIFESDDPKCKITIKFIKKGTIKVTQEGLGGECDFGHNVSANGTYRKVNGKKPKFEEMQ